MTNPNVHLWLFSLVMAVVFGIGLFGLFDPGFCWFPEAGYGLQPGTCIEYWVNRYQTMLAAGVAVAAAAAAWFAARSNLERMDTQIGIARQEAAVGNIEHYQSRLYALEHVADKIALLEAQENLAGVRSASRAAKTLNGHIFDEDRNLHFVDSGHLDTSLERLNSEIRSRDDVIRTIQELLKLQELGRVVAEELRLLSQLHKSRKESLQALSNIVAELQNAVRVRRIITAHVAAMNSLSEGILASPPCDQSNFSRVLLAEMKKARDALNHSETIIANSEFVTSHNSGTRK